MLVSSPPIQDVRSNHLFEHWAMGSSGLSFAMVRPPYRACYLPCYSAREHDPEKWKTAFRARSCSINSFFVPRQFPPLNVQDRQNTSIWTQYGRRPAGGRNEARFMVLGARAAIRYVNSAGQAYIGVLCASRTRGTASSRGDRYGGRQAMPGGGSAPLHRRGSVRLRHSSKCDVTFKNRTVRKMK